MQTVINKIISFITTVKLLVDKKIKYFDIKISLLLGLLLCCGTTNAQLIVPDSTFAKHHTHDDSLFIKQKDLGDIFAKKNKARLDTMQEQKAYKLHFSTVPAIEIRNHLWTSVEALP